MMRPQRIPMPLAIAIALGALAAAAVVVALALRSTREDGPANVATAPATNTTIAGSEATPTATTAPASRITQAEMVPFPADTSMVAATGGYGHGHGGYYRVRRVWRQGEGVVRQEDILLPLFGAEPTNVTAIEATPAGRLFASVCRGTSCILEGGPKPDVTTVFLRSDDGGVTWQLLAERTGEWFIVAAISTEALAVRIETEWEWRMVVADTVVTPPAAAGDKPNAVAYGDKLAWIADTPPALVDASGETLFMVSLPTGARFWQGIFRDAPASNVASWTLGSSPPRAFVSPVDSRGTAIDPFEWDGPSQPQFGAWLAPGKLVASVEYERAGQCTVGGRTSGADPAIVDLEAGTYAFIQDPFFNPWCSEGAQRVVAVYRGPFVRVETEGDCLNFRVGESPDAAVLTCLRDGVLLTLDGPTPVSRDEKRIAVLLPDGHQGWVSRAYVDPGPSKREVPGQVLRVLLDHLPPSPAAGVAGACIDQRGNPGEARWCYFDVERRGDTLRLKVGIWASGYVFRAELRESPDGGWSLLSLEQVDGI